MLEPVPIWLPSAVHVVLVVTASPSASETVDEHVKVTSEYTKPSLLEVDKLTESTLGGVLGAELTFTVRTAWVA